jgi:hypothetical protein
MWYKSFSNSVGNFAFVDENGRSPLHDASAIGDPDIISLLSNHRFDVNARDKNGLTPLQEACQYGYLEVVEILLELRADTTLEDNFNRTPFTIAFQYGKAKYRINWDIRQYSTIRLYYAIRQLFLVRLESGQVYCSIRHNAVLSLSA